MAFHLAQVNIGRPRGPIDGEVMREFVANLDPVNALADAAPGFVWRLQTEDGNATAISVFEDPSLIVNLSVWESIEALAEFVYRSDHRDVMVRRREWFERMGEAFLALWWIPAGHRPSVAEAEDHLRRLRADGPTAYAFTFRELFPPPDASTIAELDDDRRGCPTG
jgi:hypothetical protein